MKPSAILCADIHNRESTPKCRTDDFQKAKRKKILFLKVLQKKYNCPILVAGDVFHNWKNSPALLREAIKTFPNMCAIPGQHDLPNHQLEKLDKSSFGVLEAAGVVQNCEEVEFYDFILHCYPYGIDWNWTKFGNFDSNKRYVAMVHQLITPRGSKIPGAEQLTTKQVFSKLKIYDLIVSGDNHKPFVVGKGKKLLVNPGSMMRTTADQENHRPRVYLWYAETNEVEPVYFPIKRGVISRDHIEKVTKRNERIDEYINKMQENIDIVLNFRKNCEEYIKQNKVELEVKKIISEALEYDNF